MGKNSFSFLAKLEFEQQSLALVFAKLSLSFSKLKYLIIFVCSKRFGWKISMQNSKWFFFKFVVKVNLAYNFVRIFWHLSAEKNFKLRFLNVYGSYFVFMFINFFKLMYSAVYMDCSVCTQKQKQKHKIKQQEFVNNLFKNIFLLRKSGIQKLMTFFLSRSPVADLSLFCENCENQSTNRLCNSVLQYGKNASSSSFVYAKS